MLRAHAALACARRARRVRALPFSTAEAQPAVHVGLLFAEHFSFSAEDVAAFARLTGDTNPIHSDTSAAVAAGLKECPLPGLLVASIFPAIIGRRLPGSLYLTQTLAFRLTAPVGARLRAEVRATRVSGRRVVFDTTCFLEYALPASLHSRKVVVDGAAMAMLPPPPHAAASKT